MKPITKTKDEFYNKVREFLKTPKSDYDIISCTVKVPKKLQKVACDGSSIWSNTGDKVSTVTEIELQFHISNGDFETDSYYLQVYAKHNLNWEIYTDEGFERGISKILTELLGFKVKVGFTEQGMQNSKRASLENSCRDKGSWELANYIMNEGERI